MLNSCNIMGRITKDLELKQTPQKGTYYVRFCIACPRDLQKDTTDFIDCIAWTKTAQFITQYFKKGDRIIVTGMLTTRMSGEGKEARKYCEILVNNVQFVELAQHEAQQAPAQTTPTPTPPQVPDGFDNAPTEGLPFDIIGF